jgi:membrane associated rhomboid family serine protease
MRGFGGFSLFPPTIKTLLIINVAVFLVHHLFFGIYTIGGQPLEKYFMDYFALQPITGMDFLFGDGASFYPWQIITYQFMHAGLWHIFFNMFALWMFGSELENLWGGMRFLTYYLLCGIGAAVVQLFISPIFSHPAPTIGASGAVYGILLAFGLTFPDRPIFMFPFFIPIPAKFFVLIFAGIELLTGLTSTDGIAHFAHLGGAATGFLLLKFGDKLGIYKAIEKLFNKKSKYTQTFEQPDEKPKVYRVNWVTPEDEQKRSSSAREEETSDRSFNIGGEEITQNRIDEILDKISESGYQNLTEKEKRILNELSKKL